MKVGGEGWWEGESNDVRCIVTGTGRAEPTDSVVQAKLYGGGSGESVVGHCCQTGRDGQTGKSSRWRAGGVGLGVTVPLERRGHLWGWGC